MPTDSSDWTQTSVTTTLLLEGLKDAGNRLVWDQFVGRYRPLLVVYAGRLGLRPPDAEDVAQSILIEFSQAYRSGKYDRERGRLRDWLFGIARNQIANWRRRTAARPEVRVADAGSEADLLAEAVADDQWAALWEQEWRDAVMQQCLNEVRREVQPHTYEAFELFACRGWPADRVAAHLNITANAVFGAKRRILRRVRDLMPAVEATF